MENIVEKVINKYYGTSPLKISSLGGGFYGRVFSVELKENPFRVAVKIYLYNGMAERESTQLNTLSKHSIVKIPAVYYTHDADEFIPNDVLIMEYISGINAGKMDIKIADENRKRIGEIIVNNLISYHQTINKEGFGEINSNKYEPEWNQYYQKKAEIILEKAKNMYKDKKINEKIFNVMKKAFNNFDKIFYLPVKTARLIHGDYNTWNVLLNDDLSSVEAIIDPFNCCWADSEMDLYQLNNANGKYYGLFELYASKFSLTENYEIKIFFYELYTEIMHYYDANIDTKTKINEFEKEAERLEDKMKYYGIKI